MSFEPVPGQYYRIVAKHSGKVAEVRHAQIHRGTPIQQGDWVGGEYQQFHFHDCGGGAWNIVCRSTGRSFDVAGESWNDDVGIIQWDRHDYSTNQQFEFLPAGGGHYYIGARHSRKFLCMKEGGTDYGVPVVQHVWNGGDHFQFSFVPCEPIVSARALREVVLRGADPIRDAMLSLVGLVPTAGGGVKFLLGLLWQDAGGSLIEQVRDYVRSVARQMIDEEFLHNLAKEMDGLRNVIQQYSQATMGADKGQWMTSMLQALEKSQPNFFDMRAPEKTLPHLLTLGSMHLSALRERYDRFEELYGKPPQNPQELLQDLKNRVGLYVEGARTARQKTLEWRLGQIEFSQQMAYQDGHAHHDVFVVQDKYDGFRHVADAGQIDRSRAEGQAVLEERRRSVTESFNAELDALFGPALVWKYLDPSMSEQQKAVRVSTSSALFGGKRGTGFDGETGASYDSPITHVRISISDDSTRVRGVRIQRATGAVTTFGDVSGGQERSHQLSSGEFITAAFGTHGGPGDPPYSLYLVTSKGHIVGGGRRDVGRAWGSEPPIGAATRLETLFGWATAGQIEGLGFKWSYVRTE